MKKSTTPIIFKEKVRETSSTTEAAPPTDGTIISHPVNDYMRPRFLDGSCCDFDE